jgi:hypothetical protein
MSLKSFTSAQKLTGEMISPGAVRGRVLFLQNDYSFADRHDDSATDVEQQIARFKDHVSFLESELAEAIAALEQESARQEADILRAHTFLIKDPAFHTDVQREIVEKGRTAEAAMISIFHKMIAAFEQSENELLSQRAIDIRDILARLSRRVNQHPPVYKAHYTTLHSWISRPVMMSSSSRRVAYLLHFRSALQGSSPTFPTTSPARSSSACSESPRGSSASCSWSRGRSRIASWRGPGRRNTGR